jgi:hypothetical protein
MLAQVFNIQTAKTSEAYVSHKHGFSIVPPDGWIVDESGAFGTAVTFYGPVMPETGGRVNMNIIVETTNVTLEEYVSYINSQLTSVFEDYRLVSEGGRIIAYALRGYELVGVFTQGTHKFRNKQVIMVEEGKAFVITLTALSTNYDTYLPTFEGSLQTFMLVYDFRYHILLVLIAGIAIGGAAMGAAILYVERKGKSNHTKTNESEPYLLMEELYISRKLSLFLWAVALQFLSLCRRTWTIRNCFENENNGVNTSPKYT